MVYAAGEISSLSSRVFDPFNECSPFAHHNEITALEIFQINIGN